MTMCWKFLFQYARTDDQQGQNLRIGYLNDLLWSYNLSYLSGVSSNSSILVDVTKNFMCMDWTPCKSTPTCNQENLQSI